MKEPTSVFNLTVKRVTLVKPITISYHYQLNPAAAKHTSDGNSALEISRVEGTPTF